MLAGYQAQLAPYQAALDAYNNFRANSAKQDRPPPDMIFTHGCSAFDRPAIITFMEGFARTQTILGFEDVGNFPHRVTTFRSLLVKFPSANALSGKSIVARASARAQLYGDLKKLIFYTYPLVRGLDERYEELLALEPDVEVLFVVGDSDPLAVEMHLKAIRSRMRAKSWWLKVGEGDHALWYDGAGHSAVCNVAGQIAALWNIERDPNLRELTLGWDSEKQIATWTEWRGPAEDPPILDTKVNLAVLGSHLPGGGGNFSFKLAG
jgi:hypothetical protein